MDLLGPVAFPETSYTAALNGSYDTNPLESPDTSAIGMRAQEFKEETDKKKRKKTLKQIFVIPDDKEAESATDMRIYPVKTVPRKVSRAIKAIPEPLPKPPFIMVMVAPAGSGKTTVINDLIYRWYRDVFDEIHYISPSSNIDDNLIHVAEDEDILKVTDHLESSGQYISQLYHDKVKKNNNEHILLILDDMLGYLGDDLALLSTRFRQPQISIIVSVQKMRGTSKIGIPPTVRANAYCYLLFRVKGKLETKAIEEDLGTIYDDFDHYYKEAMRDKYSFLFCDLKNHRLYRRFEELLYNGDDEYRDK